MCARAVIRSGRCDSEAAVTDDWQARFDALANRWGLQTVRQREMMRNLLRFRDQARKPVGCFQDETGEYFFTYVPIDPVRELT